MMDRESREQISGIILRLAGVLTILVGCILTTQTIIQLIAGRSAMSNLPPGMSVNIQGAIGRVGGWAIVGQLAIVAWGALLIAVARPVARSITRE